MLWKKVIDENLPMATIFEDDIYLSKESENTNKVIFIINEVIKDFVINGVFKWC